MPRPRGGGWKVDTSGMHYLGPVSGSHSNKYDFVESPKIVATKERSAGFAESANGDRMDGL